MVEHVKYLTEEERKCPYLIIQIITATITKYGQAWLDCGHMINPPEADQIFLDEQEDGQFIALCEKCKEAENG